MKPSIEVPREFLARAWAFLHEHSRPYLVHGHESGDPWRVRAYPVVNGYVLALHPASAPACLYAATDHASGAETPRAHRHRIIARLLEAEPRRFTCEGRVVGLWQIEQRPAGPQTCARGPIALSCLSWMLNEQGSHLRIEPSKPEPRDPRSEK